MSSSLAKLNEAEIPGLIRHLEKFNAYFSRATISQRSSVSDPEEIVEELITEVSDAYKKAKECINVAFKIHQLYEKTNQKLQKVSNKNEALKTRTEEMKGQIQDQLNEFITKEKRIESLTHDLNDTEQGFKDMLSENKQLKRDIMMLKKEISLKEQGTRSRAASQEVKRLPPDLKQEQINALQLELKKQIEDAEGLSFQIKDIENLLKIEKNNSERLKLQNGSLRKDLDDTNQEVENLQNENSEFKEQLEIYRNEIIHQKILIENLRKLHEKDKTRVTFASEAGYSNHAEDEIEGPTTSHNPELEPKMSNEHGSLMSLRQKKMQDWRRTMTIDTENLGEVFESEELPDEKQFFVLSSPTSKYGQFQSFVDSVREKSILSDEILPSINIERKNKRKSEIIKAFDVEIKKKESKLRFVELIIEKMNNVKISPYKDNSRLMIDKQTDGISVEKLLIELSVETLPVIAKENKKELSVEKNQIISIERKQQDILSIENIQIFSIEAHAVECLLIETVPSIKIIKTIKPQLFIHISPTIFIENNYKTEKVLELKNQFSIEKISEVWIKSQNEEQLIIEVLPNLKYVHKGLLSIENSLNKIFIKNENFEIAMLEKSKTEPEQNLQEIMKTLVINEVLNHSLTSEKHQNLLIEKTQAFAIEKYSKNNYDFKNTILEVKNEFQMYFLPTKAEELSLESTSIVKIESAFNASLKIHTHIENIFIKPLIKKNVLEKVPTSKFDEKDFFTMESQSELKIDPNHLSMETAATAKDNAELQNKYLLKDQWHTNEVKRDILQIESTSAKIQKLNDKQTPLNYDNKTKFSQTFTSPDNKSELLELDILKSIKSPDMNNSSPKKKSKKNRRQNRKIFPQDPIKQFFILTCEAAKINSEKRDIIGQIPFDSLFSKVFDEHIPFNNWYDYIQKFLHSKIM